MKRGMSPRLHAGPGRTAARPAAPAAAAPRPAPAQRGAGSGLASGPRRDQPGGSGARDEQRQVNVLWWCDVSKQHRRLWPGRTPHCLPAHGSHWFPSCDLGRNTSTNAGPPVPPRSACHLLRVCSSQGRENRGLQCLLLPWVRSKSGWSTVPSCSMCQHRL